MKDSVNNKICFNNHVKYMVGIPDTVCLVGFQGDHVVRPFVDLKRLLMHLNVCFTRCPEYLQCNFSNNFKISLDWHHLYLKINYQFLLWYIFKYKNNSTVSHQLRCKISTIILCVSVYRYEEIRNKINMTFILAGILLLRI